MGAPTIGLRHGLRLSFRCRWLTLALTSRGEDVTSRPDQSPEDAALNAKEWVLPWLAFNMGWDSASGADDWRWPRHPWARTLLPDRTTPQRMPRWTPTNGCSHGRPSTWAGNQLQVPLTDPGPDIPGRGRQCTNQKTRLDTRLPRRVPVNGRSHDWPSAQPGARLQVPLIEPRLGRLVGLGHLGTLTTHLTRILTRTWPALFTRTWPALEAYLTDSNTAELNWSRSKTDTGLHQSHETTTSPLLLTTDRPSYRPTHPKLWSPGYRCGRPPLWRYRLDPK